MTATEPEFTPGQEVTWTGTANLFSKRVKIIAPRRSFLQIFGEGPDDAVTVYDIAAPGIKGTVYGIPAEQLHPIEQAGLARETRTRLCPCLAAGQRDDDDTPGWCDSRRMGIHQEAKG